MSKSPLLTKSLLAIALCTIYSSAFAQQTTEQQAVETTQQLETIEVQANDNDNQGIIAKKATSVLKSDAPLFETAQSVSVITQEQLQQRQVSTMNEALQGTASVVFGGLGRRGFDDVIIGANMDYVGNKKTNLTGLTIPSYQVFNVQAGYKAPYWGANLGIKNIFDEHYYAGLLGTSATQAVITYGDPRQINFSVNLDF